MKEWRKGRKEGEKEEIDLLELRALTRSMEAWRPHGH
jgi:hypothetical protein